MTWFRFHNVSRCRTTTDLLRIASTSTANSVHLHCAQECAGGAHVPIVAYGRGDSRIPSIPTGQSWRNVRWGGCQRCVSCTSQTHCRGPSAWLVAVVARSVRRRSASPDSRRLANSVSTESSVCVLVAFRRPTQATDSTQCRGGEVIVIERHSFVATGQRKPSAVTCVLAIKSRPALRPRAYGMIRPCTSIRSR